MCGIAGYVTRTQTADPAVVEKQLAELSHRGPDSVGYHVSGACALGQTRLAVIDLRTGDPPISADGGRIRVAFNGEIYNYRELREPLLKDGHVFRTAGDTEVIAHLAERTAPAGLCRALRGMFAFAVWDERDRRLVLARDHFGKKPLYYWSDDQNFVFGSEIKAVLAHPAVPAALDADVLPAYLRFGYVPEPRTFFGGIHSLPPGHILELNLGDAPRIRRYWKPRVPGVDGLLRRETTLAEAAAGARPLLSEAVERRMIADVPLGAFLSGGIDSAAVVGLMAERSNHPVRTFTMGFSDAAFDERAWARVISSRFGTEHHEFVVEPKATELVEDLVWHFDQPFGDSSAIPTFLLSRMTRGSVTVALSGDGGDELFAGYERFRAGRHVASYERLPALARRALERALATSPTQSVRTNRARLGRFLASAGAGLPDAYLAWVSFTAPDLVAALSPGGSDWDLRDFKRQWDATQGADPLDRLLALNISTYLVGDLLPKTDRMSMAHGLEVRSPFLDVDLAEFVLGLPASVKMRRGQPKAVLRHCVRDLLPAEVLNRRKKGFGVPLDAWFRTELRDYARGMLVGPSVRLRQHLDGNVVAEVLGEHLAGKQQHGELLWTLLTLEVFLRRQGW